MRRVHGRGPASNGRRRATCQFAVGCSLRLRLFPRSSKPGRGPCHSTCSSEHKNAKKMKCDLSLACAVAGGPGRLALSTAKHYPGRSCATARRRRRAALQTPRRRPRSAHTFRQLDRRAIENACGPTAARRPSVPAPRPARRIRAAPAGFPPDRRADSRYGAARRVSLNHAQDVRLAKPDLARAPRTAADRSWRTASGRHRTRRPRRAAVRGAALPALG